MQLLKGSSSHWINSNNLITGKSNVNHVAKYIARQAEHHRARTFAEEFSEFIDRHGLHWKDKESR